MPAPLSCISFLPASLLTYAYRYVTAIMGALFFLGFSMYIFDNLESKVNRILCYLGTISLGLYIMHLFIGDYIYPLYSELLSSSTSVTFVLLDSITRLFISIAMIKIIQQIPIVRFLLLGKK